MLKQGILLLATTHGYYGRMAFNLAMTIKAVDKDFPIAIITDGSALAHLNDKQRSIFDINIPATSLGFAGKLNLPEISPFEQTLFLDADMAWLPRKSPVDLIRSLKDIDFAAITEGHTDEPNTNYYFWADVDEIRRVYGIESRIYQWRSEVMYFTRSERVMGMFNESVKIYAAPGLETVSRFGDSVPDELALNIACARAGIEPHIYKWTPAYWARMHGESNQDLEALYFQYYLLSCGSNVSSANTKRVYDRVVKAAAYKMGHQHLFPLINKKEMIQSRQKV
jgi:hypothetical protein